MYCFFCDHWHFAFEFLRNYLSDSPVILMMTITVLMTFEQRWWWLLYDDRGGLGAKAPPCLVARINFSSVTYMCRAQIPTDDDDGGCSNGFHQEEQHIITDHQTLPFDKVCGPIMSWCSLYSSLIAIVFLRPCELNFTRMRSIFYPGTRVPHHTSTSGAPSLTELSDPPGTGSYTIPYHAIPCPMIAMYNIVSHIAYHALSYHTIVNHIPTIPNHTIRL